jgi:integrase
VEDRQGPGLFERMRLELRSRHYSLRTERAYLTWVKRFVDFHGRRHPRSLTTEHVEGFLNSLVTERGVSSSTHQQALCALLFLYRAVLRISAPWLDSLVRPRRTQFLPVVLTRGEVRAILDRMEGTTKLMASLLYGSGLRFLECAALRIKDLDFGNKQILIRRGKGGRGCVTLLPGMVVAMVISGNAILCRSKVRPTAAAPPPRNGSSASIQECCARRTPHKTRDVSQPPPFVCDTLARIRL